MLLDGDRMDWYSGVAEKLKEDHDYSHSDMIRLLKYAYPDMKENSYQWGLSSMLKAGQITKTGYNAYRVAGGAQQKKKYSPRYTEEAQELIRKIHKKYPLVNFTVMELKLLNEFLNHLIANNTFFVHVDRDVSDFVFRYILESGYPRVLYKPSEKERTLYWEKDIIIVLDLVSEAPLNLKAPGVTTAEKLLVDIYCDPAIAELYSQAEYPSILEQMLQKYSVDEPRMMRYARRRHREKEIGEILAGIRAKG